MVKIKVKKLHPDAVIPKQATEFAGGWDVVATSMEIVDEDFVIYKLGFSLQLPVGYKLTLVPRSSFTKTKWVLQNSPGLGDSDFTGEYQYRFRAIPDDVEVYKINGYESFGSVYTDTGIRLTYPPPPYKVGERIGQVYLEEVIPMEFEIVDEIEETKRDKNGYGTTGK